MANIRTLSDYASAPSRSVPLQAGGGQGGGGLPLFFSSGAEAGEHTSWIQWLCPGIHLKSPIVIISVVQVAVYVASLCFGLSPNDILAPTPQTLDLFGANIPEYIRAGQIWRLLCPIFLHLNLFHILMNLWVQIRIGLTMEERYGWRNFCAVYVGVGVLANMVSAAVLFCGQMKAGASTAVFALIGVQLAEVALIWHALQERNSVIFSVALCFFFVFISSFGRHTDAVGHVGGLVLGCATGIWLNKSSDVKPAWYERGLLVSKAALVVAPVLSAVFIWLVPRC
ncbi:rhomboid protease ROM2 [Besnoitia besnoiti]|uniref:Rhomboid-like protease n=1 Tax=Besnoitia besnoiti TaxID=94643 RepID=A0A2A9MMQ7_BESBE|nr:rhomboid protease ROM2 [Besnoitia besnoiti]PFH37741.1 rhomboid protease ROM2 [Besnoitia besnoiti]